MDKNRNPRLACWLIFAAVSGVVGCLSGLEWRKWCKRDPLD